MRANTQPIRAFLIPNAALSRRAMELVLSILVLAAVALAMGALVIWRRTGNALRAGLMLLLALIALANVAIWTVGDASGEAPIDKLNQLEHGG